MKITKNSKDNTRINNQIRVPNVRLIDENGNQLGIISTAEATKRASAVGLDLVEVAASATPPVCKILNYGKIKYEKQKKEAATRKKQKTVSVKEIKIRPNIDTHDYDVKMRAIEKFLKAGNKVRVILRFRGREMAHTDIGMDMMNKIKKHYEDNTKIEHFGKLENRQIIMVIAP